jgi:hypothetical protein
MRTQRGRRLPIADGITLIAAMALALVMGRCRARSFYRQIAAD